MNLNTEFNIIDVLIKLLNKWKQIILFATMTALAVYMFSTYCITPQYISRISLYVNNKQSQYKQGTVAIEDINASKSLVNTYMAFFKSDRIIDQIAAEISLPQYPADILSQKIVCHEVDDTEIFNVFIETEDPDLSAYIGNFIADIAPGEIKEVFKTGAVEVIDHAKIAKVPSSPNVKLLTLSGFLLGGILSCFLILIFDMLNQTIKSPDEIEKRYHIPLLGILPNRLKAGG